MSGVDKHIDDRIVAFNLFMRDFPEYVDKILGFLFRHLSPDGRHFLPVTNQKQLTWHSSSAKFSNSTHKPRGAFPMVKGSDKAKHGNLTQAELGGKSRVSWGRGELANVDTIGNMEELFRIGFPRLQIRKDRLRNPDNGIGAVDYVVLQFAAEHITKRLCLARITSVFPECPEFIDERGVCLFCSLKCGKSAEHWRVRMNDVNGVPFD